MQKKKLVLSECEIVTCCSVTIVGCGCICTWYNCCAPGNARSKAQIWETAAQLQVSALVFLCLQAQWCLTRVLALFFQDKLYQEEYQFVSTEEQREEISKKLSEASSWMEEEGYAAATKVLLCAVRIPVSCR